MADLTDEILEGLTDDALIIFVCKSNVQSAFMSGLIGSLQCLGYKPRMQRQIGSAFDVAVEIRSTEAEWTDERHSIGGNIGLMVYLGVCLIFDQFEGEDQSSRAEVVQTARSVSQEFEAL
ncbi:hypothetical protein LTS10_011736 [Elasticomyces elasticus]|nr:hypothetical protein LTS10_011736 [Elasticomyces elasticus]